ncbi:alpha/beta hydrolase [Georgenia daeguensis]|uniref:alpha/beta hydrolase n=1 Tax=Georgenia daeguensis TaxID=908355 RepID=UPI003CD06025
MLRVLGRLAEAGHDVWAYDQPGTGCSSRLTDPRGSTTALGVADLEQAQERIGAARVILVGHSYGAHLAAAHIAEHPDRVERAVFSPGDLRERRHPRQSAGPPHHRGTDAPRPAAALTADPPHLCPRAGQPGRGARPRERPRGRRAPGPGLHRGTARPALPRPHRPRT